VSDPRPLAVIAGGTSGIGLATARRLQAAYRLALIYHQGHERARAAEAELGKACKAFSIDLGSDSDVLRGYPEILQHFEGHPQVLINSAGIPGNSKFFLQGCSLKSCQEIMNVHYYGALRLIQRVLPGMYSRKQGTIINLSSVSAQGGYKAVVGYAEAKAALECFTQNLAVEVAHRGLSVACVAPGLVQTPMTAQHQSGLDPSSVNYPLGRWLEPSEVAEAIEFLIRMGPTINGQVLHLDGANSLIKVKLEPR